MIFILPDAPLILSVAGRVYDTDTKESLEGHWLNYLEVMELL